jgi:hypothetical protein
MKPTTAELLDRIRGIEDQMEQQLKLRRAELHADFDQHRVRFEHAVLEQQRRFKTGLLTYVLQADWRTVAATPVLSYLNTQSARMCHV